MKKQSLAGVLAVLLALCLTACGGGSSGSTGASPSVTVPPVPTTSSGVAGRAWLAGTLLESDDNPVTDFRLGLDDAGRATVLFLKGDGSRLVLYATRGVPGADGGVQWTAPAPIDVLNGVPVNGMTANTALYGLRVAPGGNAVAYWADGSGATPTLYTARYLAATNAWESPVAFGQFNAGLIQVQINDRGDVMLSGPAFRNGKSWITIAWRGSGQSSVSEHVFNLPDLFMPLTRLGPTGELMLASAFSTGRVMVYRGVVNGDFDTGQQVNAVAAPATLFIADIGQGGQEVIAWRQNNGTQTSIFTAYSQGHTGAWLVTDFNRDGGYDYAGMDESGTVTFLDLGNSWRITGSGNTWTSPQELPFFRTTGDSCAPNRHGDVLCVNYYTGLWLSYDGRKNALVHDRTPVSPGSGYILGLQSSTGVTNLLLSGSGVGLAVTPMTLDVLPTAALPTGSGHGVSNLWAFSFR